MGGGISRLVSLKGRLRDEIKRLHRGMDAAPVVILACSNLRDNILSFVRSDQVADIIHDLDGTTAVAAAVKKYNDEKTVLKAIVPLVTLLAHTEKNARKLRKLKVDSLLENMQRSMYERGESGLDVVVLHEHIDQAMAYIRGLWAPERCIDECIEERDADRLVFLLTHTYHLPDASCRAAAALLDWSQNSPINRDKLCKLSCHRYLIAAMQSAYDHSDLAANGAGALAELAKNSAASREIGRYGGVKVLVEILTRTFHPIEAHQQAVWCLSQLALVDENLSRMKEMNVRLVLNEVRTRKLKNVVEERDKRGRRGEAARISVILVAPMGGESLDEKALFVPRRLENIKWSTVSTIHVTTHDPRRSTPKEILESMSNPGLQTGAVKIVGESDPMCFVGKLPKKPPLHKVDIAIAKAEEEAKAAAEGRLKEEQEEAARKAAMPDFDPEVTPRSDAGFGESKKEEEEEEKKEKKGSDDSESDSDSDGDSTDSELAGLSMEERLALERYRAGEKAAPFEEFLKADRSGAYKETPVDVRKELRAIKAKKQGRFAFGGGFYRGSDFLDNDDAYFEGDVRFDEDEANMYDLKADVPERRDPYLQALNRELVPDQVEKFFDPVTNSVRVRRRFTIVEKKAFGFFGKGKKVIVPYQLKYHTGKGGIDPKLQPTYPLSAVLGSVDEVINADPDLNRAKSTVPKDERESATAIQGTTVFNGFFRKE